MGACRAAGRITRYQKNAPKPTVKIAASRHSCNQETRTAAARMSRQAVMNVVRLKAQKKMSAGPGNGSTPRNQDSDATVLPTK